MKCGLSDTPEGCLTRSDQQELPMRNLFNELFTFRVRENFSAKENFLTEAFAYFLQRDMKVCNAFVKAVFKKPVEIEPGYQVTTRNVERLTSGNCFPDLKLLFRTSDGLRCAILSEHKWDSNIRQDQLSHYGTVLDSFDVDERRLVTIVERPDQKRAAKMAPVRVQTTHLLWEDLYEMLQDIDGQDALLAEFIGFMKMENLNPGPPIEAQTMRAFLASTNFKPQLIRYASKLLNGYDWSSIPGRYRSIPEVRDRYGRIALEFKTAEWNPTLTAGFLYDPSDHRVTFTAPGESIDLFLRLECNPIANNDAEISLNSLREKAKLLRDLGPRVLLRGDNGNGNRYSLLIAQEKLQSVIGESNEERAQIEAIYHKLIGWIACLFKDGSLEKALNSLKPFGVSSIPVESAPIL